MIHMMMIMMVIMMVMMIHEMMAVVIIPRIYDGDDTYDDDVDDDECMIYNNHVIDEYNSKQSQLATNYSNINTIIPEDSVDERHFAHKYMVPQLDIILCLIH